MANKKPVSEEDRPTWTRLPIKEWLEFLERSQAWLAKESGYSEPFISLVLAGKRPYNQPVLEAMARTLSKAAGQQIDPSMLFHAPRSKNQWTFWRQLQEMRHGEIAERVQSAFEPGPSNRKDVR